MHEPTDADLILRWPWTLHRKMLKQQLQATETIARSLPCIYDFAPVHAVSGG